jgi:hypothetical protein
MSTLVTRAPEAPGEHRAPRQLTEQLPKPSGTELLSEVSDLVTGAGLLIFVLAPFALPGLALAAVAIVVLLIPVLIGAILTAPILLVWRWWHSRDHTVAEDRRRDHEASSASNAPVTVDARPMIRDAA